MEKEFKTFKQQHDEEFYRYVVYPDIPELEMYEYDWEDAACVPIKNNLVVYIPIPEIQKAFPFSYNAEISGDYEQKLEGAKNTVNLDYAIQVNTEPIDFILDHLRQKPDIELGALYLVRENQKLPASTRFRIVKYLRKYPDTLYMGGSETEQMVLLKDADDRKALYSAYKKIRSNIVKQLTEWENQYKHNAFEIVMYNSD